MAHSTATLRLAVGDLRIVHPVTVPSGPVEAADIVPALQGLVNAVVAAAEAGRTVSCRKGCGACCRQLVPVSPSEGERLLCVVAALPRERREALQARFAAAETAIEGAGLDQRQGRSDRDLSVAYFALRLPCPFLEDESCSIHQERPLICREYLVSSPPQLCAGPTQEGVTPLPVPKVSLAARGLQDEADDWFPLALLMAWRRTRPRRTTRRTGPEWMQRFLRQLGRK
ncbi:MAG: YkgJ family cysteine cluster protein [Reyranella sp.]|uniref:YkgJ family cysteine cluster protein n=1 Tax=Reyranella sp. TaxID=1929291 RepID=UPI003D0DF2D7